MNRFDSIAYEVVVNATIGHRLATLTESEIDRIDELITERNDWVHCSAPDFDPMQRREKIIAIQKEVESILHKHGLQVWQYLEYQYHPVVMTPRKKQHICEEGEC